MFNLFLTSKCENKEETEESTKIEVKGSIDLDDLYDKLEKTCNPQELRKIKELWKIINDIKNFENELIEENNKTSQLKYGFVNIKIANFVTRMVTNIARVVETFSVS